MLDFEFPEKIQIFILKCLLAVMLFLIQNVVVYIRNVDDDRLVDLVFDNSTHILEHFIPPILTEQILPPFYHKDDLHVNLKICSGHIMFPPDFVLLTNVMQAKYPHHGEHRVHRDFQGVSPCSLCTLW
jgi:hypothetical protein